MEQVPKIRFENDKFLVVDKPSGWLTIPGRTGASDPRPCLIQELRKTGRALWAVHRLDAEVSGLVLFAREPGAHRQANAWFEGRAVKKTYEAWTEGSASEGGWQEWRSALLRGKRRAYASVAGKPTLTRACWIGPAPAVAATGDAQYWRLEPMTGRPHQLRFELAAHGHPILGDALYGARSEFRAGAIALRAVELDFAGCDGAASHGLPEKLCVDGLEAFVAHA